MKTYLFHELRHAWQLWQNNWKEKFGGGSSRLTDLDVEVDAYETQYIMEDLLGIDTNDIYRPFGDSKDTQTTPIEFGVIKNGFYITEITEKRENRPDKTILKQNAK